jgi:hypothetical protein
MLDFLTVYAATQKDGSWDSLKIGSTTDPVQQAKIRAALFGTGVKIGGLIDSSKVLLGGTGLALGSQMGTDLSGGSTLSGKALGTLMGNVLSDADYAAWVKPLQQAMIEFNINTPQRIAAFLAQIRVESGGLRTTTEDLHYRPAVAAKKFPVFGGSVTAATTYFQTQLRRPGQAIDWYTHSSNWRPDQLEQFGNYVYRGRLGNTQVGDGWKFRGHGLVQTGTGSV